VVGVGKRLAAPSLCEQKHRGENDVFHDWQYFQYGWVGRQHGNPLVSALSISGCTMRIIVGQFSDRPTPDQIIWRMPCLFGRFYLSTTGLLISLAKLPGCRSKPHGELCPWGPSANLKKLL
jgi:hypothetical protein